MVEYTALYNITVSRPASCNYYQDEGSPYTNVALEGLAKIADSGTWWTGDLWSKTNL